MNEAGGLDNLQVELRSMGMPFVGTIGVYQNRSGNDPTPDDITAAVDYFIDDDSADRQLPVISVSNAGLRAHTPFDGSHPGRTIVAPDGTVVAHFGGHGNGNEARQAVIDAWEAGQ